MRVSQLPARLLQKIGFPLAGRIPAQGVYHYLQQEGASKVRLHLRLEEDGHGTLLVNASRLFHFNPTPCSLLCLCWIHSRIIKLCWNAEKAGQSLSHQSGSETWP